MKRLFLVGLVVMLTTGGALFAAGQGEGGAASTAGGEGEIASYMPDPQREYKLTLTVQGGPAVPLDENADMLVYWEEKFGVDIELIDITGLGGDAGVQKLNLMLTSGDIPDQFQANALNLEKYYESGLLAPMDDEVLKAYMPSIMKKLDEESNGSALNYGKFDGTRYGLIRGFWWPAQYRSNFILRGDWLNNVGLPVPKTLEDYEEVFYAFTNDDPDGNGKDDTYGLSETMVDRMYGAFGVVPGQWSEVNGELVCDDIQVGMKEALRYLHKWYEDGVLDPEFVTGENQGGYWAITHTFMNGRIGSTSMGNVYHWTPDLPGRSAGADYTEASKVGIYEDLVFAEPPIGPGGKQAAATQGELVSNSFLVYGTQLQDDPDKMGKLMQMSETMFGGDKEMFLTVFMGEKGEHWEYDSQGFPKLLEGLDAREMQKRGAWGAFLWFQFINESRLTDGAVMQWAEEHDFTVGRKETKVPSFINTPARAQYQAELEKIRDETFTAIILGNEPIDYFDDYVAKWKRSGGDQLTEELNEWYASIQ